MVFNTSERYMEMNLKPGRLDHTKGSASLREAIYTQLPTIGFHHPLSHTNRPIYLEHGILNNS